MVLMNKNAIGKHEDTRLCGMKLQCLHDVAKIKNVNKKKKKKKEDSYPYCVAMPSSLVHVIRV